ncbi:hypothetical protein KEM52_000957 [Ascosphaera acerosa]|nr:hypothetical protein KEM52_000957 [Ascosphaera acerosa]
MRPLPIPARADHLYRAQFLNSLISSIETKDLTKYTPPPAPARQGSGRPPVRQGASSASVSARSSAEAEQRRPAATTATTATTAPTPSTHTSTTLAGTTLAGTKRRISEPSQAQARERSKVARPDVPVPGRPAHPPSSQQPKLGVVKPGVSRVGAGVGEKKGPAVVSSATAAGTAGAGSGVAVAPTHAHTHTQSSQTRPSSHPPTTTPSGTALASTSISKQSQPHRPAAPALVHSPSAFSASSTTASALAPASSTVHPSRATAPPSTTGTGTGAGAGAATATAIGTGTGAGKAPPKGSFADILARAKALQEKGPAPPAVGLIKHATQPKDQRPSKGQLKRKLEEARLRERQEATRAKKGGPGVDRPRPGKPDPAEVRHERLKALKQRGDGPAYKGTARSAASTAGAAGAGAARSTASGAARAGHAPASSGAAPEPPVYKAPRPLRLASVERVVQNIQDQIQDQIQGPIARLRTRPRGRHPAALTGGTES